MEPRLNPNVAWTSVAQMFCRPSICTPMSRVCKCGSLLDTNVEPGSGVRLPLIGLY